MAVVLASYLGLRCLVSMLQNLLYVALTQKVCGAY